MLKKYSIDVIVPAFNAEDTIERCLNSLLNQKYENLRVIIIDDGSNDNTNSIVSEICKSSNGKALLVTQQNAGVSVARNKGLEISNADFIGFVDADDYVLEDMPNHFSIFVCADDEYREKRGKEVYEGKTLKELNEENEKRARKRIINNDSS